MKTAIIAKFLLEQEDISALKRQKVQFDERFETIGRVKVPCYKFYNLDENGVFDKIDSANVHRFTLSEAGEGLVKTFTARAWSVIFSEIRKVNAMERDGTRTSAVCSLLSTCVSMANLDVNMANRILQLIRNL